MGGCEDLILCFDGALSTAVTNIKEDTYDTNSVLSAVNRLGSKCRNETEHIRSASQILRCADRLYSVYSACFEMFCNLKGDICEDVKVYCNKCAIAAVNVLSVCRELLYTDVVVCEGIDIVTADTERLLFGSREIRMSVVSRHRRIFSALSELECIDRASSVLRRCLRLIDGCTVFRIGASVRDAEEIQLF